MTKRVMNPTEGRYKGFTRYTIIQHKSDDDSIELLEIQMCPEEKCPYVIHELTDAGSVFTEWNSLDNAKKAFEERETPFENKHKFPLLEGFKRRVECEKLTPWFYAVGKQIIIRDFAFPENFQEDPYFRFGQKFVIFDGKNEEVKTCLGCRFVPETEHKPIYRVVYWDDGSFWDESQPTEKRPERIEV